MGLRAMPAGARVRAIRRARRMPRTAGSTPTAASRGRVFARCASMVGTSFSPTGNSRSPVPRSCRRAWRWYRPSVHRPPPSSPTTTSPAEPVNPLAHSRRAQCSGTYSLWCGSLDGTR